MKINVAELERVLILPQINAFVIQHIDIHCPNNMVIKLSMYVGLNNVYSAMDVNLAF